MIFPVAISLVILLLYILKMGIYGRYWKEYPVFEKNDVPSLPVSLVIPFRNEQENLPGLLRSVGNQKYPDGLWEVILVDDHSSDLSARIVNDFTGHHRNFRYVRNEQGENGKKASLLRGVRNASYELIVTTDADCMHGENWLSTLCSFYATDHPAMIIGLVDTMEVPGFFNRFREIEFMSLVAAGAAAAAGGKPIYCNAANFAFEKELMLSLPDPMNHSVISGDDTLFMHRIKKDRKARIRLLKSPEAVVTTQGPQNFRLFMEQRIRWASKSRNYSDRDTIYTAFLVLLVSMVIIMSMGMAIAGKFPWLFPVLLLAKTLADYFFLLDFFRFFGKKKPVIPFAGFEIIYPFYVVLSAGMGIFSLYTWKGRKGRR